MSETVTHLSYEPFWRQPECQVVILVCVFLGTLVGEILVASHFNRSAQADLKFNSKDWKASAGCAEIRSRMIYDLYHHESELVGLTKSQILDILGVPDDFSFHHRADGWTNLGKPFSNYFCYKAIICPDGSFSVLGPPVYGSTLRLKFNGNRVTSCELGYVSGHGSAPPAHIRQWNWLRMMGSTMGALLFGPTLVTFLVQRLFVMRGRKRRLSL